MPVVPMAKGQSKGRRQAPPAPAPDDTYLAMAAAMMHKEGRLFPQTEKPEDAPSISIRPQST